MIRVLLLPDYFRCSNITSLKQGVSQCCHSNKIKKNLVGPIKNPRKPKVTFLYIWLRFLGKIQLFLGKSQLFPQKLPFYPPKFLTTFFSHQLGFSIIYHISRIFGPKSTTNFLLRAQKH